ncbi:MAG: hypothetical protein ABIK28_02035, partial [Planctomycetota bacterium]
MMTEEERENIRIQYKFDFGNGREARFEMNLDGETLDCVDPLPPGPPAWVKLEYHQCPHCPLSAKTEANCPLAIRLSGMVEVLDQVVSYDEVHVEVTTDERFVSLDTSAQKGISSLMGLMMATSGCPHTAFFKPMARFHLPFAQQEETLYRATSMYLLAQYFVKNEGQEPDLELNGLTRIYERIETLNVAIANRLRHANETDSAVNAVVILDMYAKSY